jgi:hypothetical protein
LKAKLLVCFFHYQYLNLTGLILCKSELIY